MVFFNLLKLQSHILFRKALNAIFISLQKNSKNITEFKIIVSKYLIYLQASFCV